MGTIFAFFFALFCFAILLIAAGLNWLGNISLSDGSLVIGFVLVWIAMTGTLFK